MAAANWPVALVQSGADALAKLLAATPLIGGAILSSIVIGADLTSLRTGDWAALVSEVVGTLLQHGPVLVTFLLSATLMIVGASLFVFLVKGGTMGTIVRGERQAGPVEVPPLQPAVLATAGAFSIELFVDAARSLFPRYARLGLGLMASISGPASASSPPCSPGRPSARAGDTRPSSPWPSSSGSRWSISSTS